MERGRDEGGERRERELGGLEEASARSARGRRARWGEDATRAASADSAEGASSEGEERRWRRARWRERHGEGEKGRRNARLVGGRRNHPQALTRTARGKRKWRRARWREDAARAASDEIPPLNLGWKWGWKQIQPKNPTPRRSSSMDDVLAPLTMNTKIQTQKKKWCPGSRIQVCDMQTAFLS